MRLLKQSSTAQPLVFLMVDSSDHITGKTGLTVTVTLSKSGGSFASPSGSVSEIGSGWYKVAGNATDTNTLGPLILHATATGADPSDPLFEIVAFDPQTTSMGLVLAKTTNLTGLNDIAATDVVSSGAITTSAGAVTVGTNNDKTGYALSSGGVTAVQSGLSTYAGGDTAGTTTLLARIPTFPTNFSSLGINASGHISRASLVDTLTTYTGNTVQTGDAYARIGVAGADLTGLGDTRIANLDATVSSRSTYAGGDTTGVGTLLTRLSSARAGYLDNLSAGSVALASGVVLSATQSLYAPAKAGDAMTLTTGERTAIANEVEAQIIDDTDSEKVLKAITDKIASVNPDLGSLSVGAIASASATAVWGATGRTVDSVSNIHAQTDDVVTVGTSLQTALAALQTHGNAAWATATGFATSGDIPSANAISENLLKYDWTAISGDPASRSVLNALRVVRNGFSITGTTMSVLKEDDSTAAYTRSLTVDPSAEPIIGVS